MSLDLLFSYLCVAIGLVALVTATLKFTLITAQQSEYSHKEFLSKYGGKHTVYALTLLLVYCVVMIVLGASGIVSPLKSLVTLPFAVIGIIVWFKKLELKKPFLWTQKVKAVYGGALLIFFLTLTILFSLSYSGEFDETFFLIFFLCGIIGVLLIPFLVSLVLLILQPIQKVIEQKKKRELAGRLHNTKTRFVGVAGSYGKTSTKYFLYEILKVRFKTEMTQGSYNTLLGVIGEVAKKMQTNPEIFIVEMGAYKRGEVKEIAGFIKPSVGILTALGPEHFQKFKSMEEIEKAEFEIIESLTTDGFAIVNTDTESGKKLFSQTEIRKIEVNQSHIHNFTIKDAACSFEYKGITYQTNIVSKLGLSNLISAIEAALYLGMSQSDIVQGVKNVKPAPHRLEVIKNGPVTVLDDAYNSNPSGARDALETLAHFPGRKILVTPGMVELGEKQFEENKKFAQAALEICDLILYVNKTNRSALLAAGQPNKVMTFDTLALASAWIQKNTHPGDVLLFENDLPDIYD